MINIIAAVAGNGVIGNNGRLPWSLKEDMSRFKALTMGACVIFGRNTFDEISKALSGRFNVVLTSRPLDVKDVTVCQSLEEALKLATGKYQEIFICGGEDVYRQAMKYADRLYITRISKNFDGDRFFPKIPKEFILTSKYDILDSGIDTTFCIYERK
jgi:dihydrofolate reductase